MPSKEMLEKIAEIESRLNSSSSAPLLDYAKNCLANPGFFSEARKAKGNAVGAVNAAFVRALAEKGAGEIKEIAQACCELAILAMGVTDDPNHRSHRLPAKSACDRAAESLGRVGAVYWGGN